MAARFRLPGRSQSEAGGTPAIVVALVVTAFVEWMGGGALLPLLPLYLRREGASDVWVGVIMAAFFAAGVLSQYTMGRLSDRVGRRPVLIGGLAAFAAGTLAFLIQPAPLFDMIFRALQGGGAGATTAVAAAVVADNVPSEWQGRAFGALMGGRVSGLAIGPLAGSLAGLAHMRLLFVAAAVCAAAATVPVLAVLPRRVHGARREGRASRVGAGSVEEDQAGGPRRRRRVRLEGWRRRAVVGVLVLSAAGGFVIGVYEVCWSLLLNYRGAAEWQIGLSWTLFAIPFAAASVPAGWLADRLDRRWLAGGSLAATALFAATYSQLHVVAIIVGLGTVEALAVAVSSPASLSLLALATPEGQQGRYQGAAGTAQMAATTVAAAMGGAMFGVAPALPFLVGAGVAAASAASLAWIWRGVPDRPNARGRQPGPQQASSDASSKVEVSKDPSPVS